MDEIFFQLPWCRLFPCYVKLLCTVDGQQKRNTFWAAYIAQGHQKLRHTARSSLHPIENTTFN